jgi:hypothetical protein
MADLVRDDQLELRKIAVTHDGVQGDDLERVVGAARWNARLAGNDDDEEGGLPTQAPPAGAAWRLLGRAEAKPL